MNERVAVAIGIARAGSLPELHGAVNGAQDFAQWAEARGYATHLVTDESGPVEARLLSDLLRTIVEAGETARLLLFFAGHGIQPIANTAFWLLSGWEDDSNEAVNVTLSLMNAKRSGIDQVAVFADACRSTVQDAGLVGGCSIFPKRKLPGGHTTRFDNFFATRLDEISQEVANPDPKKAFGIFTRCLVAGLSGQAADAIETRNGVVPVRAVTSHKLAAYLETAVREMSGRTPGALVQTPDVEPGWWPPDNVYLDADGLPVPQSFRSEAHGLWLGRANEARIELDGCARAFEDRVRAARGRLSFETRQGLTIVGAQPVAAMVDRREPPPDLFQENDAWHVRGRADAPQTVLVRLATGAWIGTCILPGFVGTLVVDSGAASSLLYVPAVGGPRDNEVPHKVVDLATQWIALARQGRFPSPRERTQALADLSRRKHVNPTLGILLAYALERSGDLAGIVAVAAAFEAARQPVPFDIAMLLGRPTTGVAGRFPLLAQGWALVEPDDPGGRSLTRLWTGLLPSLVTTLRPDQGEELARLLANGAL